MKSSIVLDELLKLQHQYLRILKHIVDNELALTLIQIVDCIDVFWKSNEKFISYCTSNIFVEKKTAIFTTSRIINTNDFEHIPFLILNDYHIWDDPTPSYLAIIDKIENIGFSSTFKEQILELLKDNIIVLENYFGVIIVLPITYYNELTKEDVFHVDRFFFGMFSCNYSNVIEYLNENKSIEDISKNLIFRLHSRILFSNDDDVRNDFITRYKEYINSTELPITNLGNDSEKFRFIMMGFFIQAYKCLILIMTYKFIPYIRNKITLNYVLQMINSLDDSLKVDIQEIIDKMIVSFIFHNQFDKDVLSRIDEKSIIEIGRNKKVEEQIFLKIYVQNRNISSLELSKLIKTIDECLDNAFYCENSKE